MTVVRVSRAPCGSGCSDAANSIPSVCFGKAVPAPPLFRRYHDIRNRNLVCPRFYSVKWQFQLFRVINLLWLKILWRFWFPKS